MHAALRRAHGAVLVLAALAGPAAAQDEISSFAFVQPDGSLRISGQVIRLHGIYIPPTGQSCHAFERPPRCGPRAVLALEFRVAGEFVHCRPLARNPDQSISATCSASGEDLAAWLLERGWALAAPDAPFAYAALERIARAKGIGVWGIPVEPAVPR